MKCLRTFLPPYSNERVFIQREKLESISFMFCMRICLSCVKSWQWRRKSFIVSVSLSQSQIGFRESRKLWRNLDCLVCYLTKFICRIMNPRNKKTICFSIHLHDFQRIAIILEVLFSICGLDFNESSSHSQIAILFFIAP